MRINHRHAARRSGGQSHMEPSVGNKTLTGYRASQLEADDGDDKREGKTRRQTAAGLGEDIQPGIGDVSETASGTFQLPPTRYPDAFAEPRGRTHG